MQRLQRIRLAGFRSIRDMDDGLELRRVNVLIGANGTGKSNLIAFFSLLNYLTTENLTQWTLEHGGAAGQLYYGPKVTPQIEAELEYSDGSKTSGYHLRLFRVSPDSLLFADEVLRYHLAGHEQPMEVRLPGGGAECELLKLARQSAGGAKATTARVLRQLLERTKVFHFHDTSAAARIKTSWRLHDGAYLKWDGANLAPVLHNLREAHGEYYDRLVRVIRQVVPFFGDFYLEPDRQPDPRILLQWRERGSDMVFGPHQLSDGTLRFMLLATLLLHPPEAHTRVVIIDEPELGLHPAAVEALGNMVYTASEWTQVILTTQSPSLLDVFDADDVVVVSRVQEEGRTGRYETCFKKLLADELMQWEEFSLSELWDKNVLGGRPAA